MAKIIHRAIPIGGIDEFITPPPRLELISSPFLVSKWSVVKMFSIQLLSSCDRMLLLIT